jgi:hypothetical protein
VIDRKQEQEQEQKSLIEELDRLLETGNFAGYQERCVALMYAAEVEPERDALALALLRALPDHHQDLPR